MKVENASRTGSPTGDIIRGNWNIVKGKLKQEYGELTDNDLSYVEGKEDELLGRLQKRTGHTRQQLERFIRDCNESCGCE